MNSQETPMHKIRLCFILSSVILFIPLHGNAKSNFEEGYMISNTGDTISGWIDFRDWNTGPFIIEFKSDLSLPALKLNAHTIQEFSVHGFHYKSIHVDMDITSDNPATLPVGPMRKLWDDKIFARVYIQSDEGLNLYYHADENDKKHFFCGMADSVVELRKIIYLDTANLTKMIINEWLVTLVHLTAGCPFALDHTSSEFTLESIINAVIAYNECMDFEFMNYLDEGEKKSLFGLSAGVSSAKIIYHSDIGGEYYSTADYSSGPGFTAGFFYDFDLPHRRETWWISTNFFIHKFHCTGLDESENSLTTQHTEIDFNQIDFKILATLKMQTNTQPFRAYIKAGPSVSKSMQSSNATISITTNKFTNAVDSVSLENDIQKNVFHFSGFASGGINWKNKVFFEVGWERGFLIENYDGVDGFENDFYATFYFALN